MTVAATHELTGGNGEGVGGGGVINYWLPIPFGALAYWLAERSANHAATT